MWIPAFAGMTMILGQRSSGRPATFPSIAIYGSDSPPPFASPDGFGGALMKGSASDLVLSPNNPAAGGSLRRRAPSRGLRSPVSPSPPVKADACHRRSDAGLRGAARLNIANLPKA